MAQPVWVLSVDLQTRTAAFTSGMSEAARSARHSFAQIRDSARESGDGVMASSTNVRAGLGLIDNTIRGNHAAAMADLVREFQNTSVVMGLLPFAAVIGGIAAVAGIVVEGIAKYREYKEAQEQLRLEMVRFDSAAQTTFNGLDDKLIQAQKQAAELKNNHLEAVRKELELIDHQSFEDLTRSLESFEKSADEVFKKLEGNWYTLGVGSDGAKHALDEFTTAYGNLVEHGKTGEASSLLGGTLDQAKAVLGVMQQMQAYHANWEEQSEGMKNAALKLYQLTGRDSYTDKELASQRALVATLEHQAAAEQKIAAIKATQSSNVVRAEGNRESGVGSERARQAAAAEQAIAEAQLQGDKAVAMGRLEITRATVEQRLQVELDFAARDHAIKETANRAELAALDKAGKDYANQVAEHHNKARELDAQYTATQAELRSRAAVEQNQRDIQNLEAGERAKIAATQEASVARIAAIDAAIKTAQQRGLQDTDFYRTLGTQRVEVERKMFDEESKLRAEALKEAAEHAQRMGEIALDALLEQQAVQDSVRRMTDARREVELLAAEQRDFDIKRQAIEREQAALDQNGKDYANKLKALQDRELEMVAQHEAKKTAIMDQATINRNQRILSAETAFQNSIAQGLTSVLMRHQTFAQMIGQFGDQVASGLLQNAIKSVLANDYTKESDAAAAARKAYLAGMQLPFPVNVVAAPVMAAGAFAAVMAFEGGTDRVPGTGRGDVTPAMLTPGEGVVPGGVMDGLRKVANNGGFDGSRATVHAPMSFAPTVHALDAEGVDRVLNKHADRFQKHFERVVRRMNK